ncbi:protein LDOC1-like [Ambystoma mexicanum]|uniref:protein LDOC1-like n=1 Tax=Ambystoma mexicanum TaxID=8296 RepID=UPI0037E7465A
MDDSQELRNEIRALRAEMTALHQENLASHQLVAQGATSSTSAESVMAQTSPVKCYGDPRRVAEFCNHCRIHFLCRPTHFNQDKAKIGYILGNLTGNAQAWAIPLVVAKSPVLEDFVAFEKAFLEVFQPPNLAAVAQNQLMDLKQGSSDIITYMSLSDAEKKRRQDLRLCLYCGASGHYLNTCPLRPLRKSEN